MRFDRPDGKWTNVLNLEVEDQTPLLDRQCIRCQTTVFFEVRVIPAVLIAEGKYSNYVACCQGCKMLVDLQ
jgi:hypothetical protein